MLTSKAFTLCLRTVRSFPYNLIYEVGVSKDFIEDDLDIM